MKLPRVWISCVRTLLPILGLIWLSLFAALKWLIASIRTDPRFMDAPPPYNVASAAFMRATVVLSILICAAWVLYLKKDWLRQLLEARLFFIIESLGASLFIVYTLIYQGRESVFQLLPIIEHPGNYPITGHRLLFIWPAQLLHHLWPTLTSKILFIATQVPAAIFTTVMIGLLSEAFVGRRLAFLGQFFLLAFLLPTITYYDFYDIAIVGFYAAILLLAIRKRFWITVPIIALATLNHENIVLLIPAIAFCAAASLPKWKWLAVAGCALAAHLGTRAIVWFLMPMSDVSELRFYSNAIWIGHPTASLMVGLAILSSRWACIYMGWKYAPLELKRLALYWPLLFLVTVGFGQLTETRQFDADIPLAVAFLLVYVRRSFESLSADTPSQRESLMPASLHSQL